jgi:hypothetical protein
LQAPLRDSPAQNCELSRRRERAIAGRAAVEGGPQVAVNVSSNKGRSWSARTVIFLIAAKLDFRIINLHAA